MVITTARDESNNEGQALCSTQRAIRVRHLGGAATLTVLTHRKRGRERMSGDDVSPRAQCPLRAGAGVRRRLPSARPESDDTRSGVSTRGGTGPLERLGRALRHAVFQVARQSGHVPARTTLLVREARDGAIELWYRGVMHWTEIAAPVKPLTAVARPRLSSSPHRLARPRPGAPVASRHPGHRSRALSRAVQPWRACGSCRRRGRRQRAPRCLENQKTFPRAPTSRLDFSWDADISIALAKNGDISTSL